MKRAGLSACARPFAPRAPGSRAGPRARAAGGPRDPFPPRGPRAPRAGMEPSRAGASGRVPRGPRGPPAARARGPARAGGRARREADDAVRVLDVPEARAARQAVLRAAGRARVHGVARDPVVVAAPHGRHALDGEQPLLERDPVARVARQPARGADDAVAGHDDRQGVPAERLRDRADRRGLADLARDAGVGHHGAVRDRRGGREHPAVEVAPRQAQVERPLEPRALVLEVLHQLAIEDLDVRAVLDRLDARRAEQPRAPRVPPGQVLDERHALLRPRDEEGTEGRGEDAVQQRPLPEVGQARLQARARRVRRRRGRAPPRGHRPAEVAVARERRAARGAGGAVRLHARRLSGGAVARRRGGQGGLDLEARARRSAHRVTPGAGISCPSRPRRILRRAWKTCARALSDEQSRLRAIVS